MQAKTIFDRNVDRIEKFRSRSKKIISFCNDNYSNYYLKIILKNILKTMVNHGNMVSLPW